MPEIRAYLERNYRDNHKSLSFLLHSEHGFKQAPYEEVTKEQFDELMAKTTVITKLENIKLDLDASDECTSGACPIR